MRSRIVVHVVLAGLLAGSLWADSPWNMFEDFDHCPLGPVSTCYGWSDARAPDADAEGQVVNDNAFSGNQCLALLPTQTGSVGDMQTALYTDLDYTYAQTNGAILHLMARVYRDNTDQNLVIGIMDSQQTTNLRVSTLSDGTIRCQNFATGAPFVTGRYAMLDLHYNFTNRRARLTYNGAVVLNWTSVGALSFTQYCNLFIDRLYESGTDSGDIRIDDVCLEIINAEDTVAWWRFEQSATNRLIERTGRYTPASLRYSPKIWEPSPWDALKVDGQSVANRFALQYPNTYNATCSVATLDFNNWTYEMILRVRTNFNEFNLLDLEESGGASIKVTVWQDGDVTLFAGDTVSGGAFDTYHSNAEVPFDDQWHHLAIVKDGGVMSFYIDYQYINGYLTQSDSGDSYSFDVNSTARFGYRTSTNIVFDECRLTSHGLTPDEFLQIPAPCISTVDTSAGSQWHFDAMTVPGTDYDLFGSLDLMGSWSSHDSLSATGFISRFTINKPVTDSRFYCVREP